jgi:hypothetical protein
VDDEQVEVVEAESREGSVERPLRLLLALILNPQLGRDEQLITRNAAGCDCPADRLFVDVRARGVERPVSGFERRDDCPFRLLCRDLKDAET